MQEQDWNRSSYYRSANILSQQMSIYKPLIIQKMKIPTTHCTQNFIQGEASSPGKLEILSSSVPSYCRLLSLEQFHAGSQSNVSTSTMKFSLFTFCMYATINYPVLIFSTSTNKTILNYPVLIFSTLQTKLFILVLQNPTL